MRHRLARHTLVLALVASAVTACTASVHRQLVELRPTADPVLFRDVRVFAGTGPYAIEHLDVLVRDGRIVMVAATGGQAAVGVRVIEGHGRTLLPGFIDSHVHTSSPGTAPWQDVPAHPEANLAGWLYAGVTTVYDLGGVASDTHKLRRRVQAGEIPGPRIFLTHVPITAPGGHPLPAVRAMAPWPLSWLAKFIVPQVATPADATATVADAVERDVDYVKITCDQIPPGSPELDEPRLRALVAEAHRHGKKAFVHVGSADDALWAAHAGADALAHMVWRTPLRPAQAAELKRAGVHVILTLAGWQGVVDMLAGRYRATDLDREISPAALLNGVEGAAGRQFGRTPVLGEMAMAARDASPYWRDNIRALWEAGVPLLVGTDSPLPGAYVGGSLHEEMRLMVEAGVPPGEVLLGATGRAARLLNPEPEFGVIAVGKRADLVLVDGDPVADIGATRRIVLVLQDGREVVRLPPAVPTR